MSDLVYVSEQKIYGRLGIKPPASQSSVQGAIKVPQVAEVTANRTWDGAQDQRSPHSLVEKARRKVERQFDPVDFTENGLKPNQWIKFDLPMAQVAVHEDSGVPPEDVALFAGSAEADRIDRNFPQNLMLCGSVQHVRTRVIPAGRMGSDSTWLHDLILELERREESNTNVVPEFLDDVLPTRRSHELIESTALGVFGWINRDYPPKVRSRLRGHAIVLMDIDGPDWMERLVVASPLYVESLSTSVEKRRRFSLKRRRTIRA